MKQYRVYSNNQRTLRDRYDGLLFTMILIGTGLVGLASCNTVRNANSDLTKYRIQQDQIRTNYTGVIK